MTRAASAPPKPATPGVAIVTGAARRVGRVLADGLIAAGWQVVAHVHHADDEVSAGEIRAVADLAAPDCADRLFAACPEPPRLIVNNAARFAPDSLDAFDPAELALHIAVNVAAPALLTAAMARAAASAPEADRLIVNILDAKLRAPNPDFLSYTLSKAALAQLTEVSARALAGQGIRVNAIAPALMLPSAGQSEANYVSAHSFNPLRHGVTPDDVCRALFYLIDAPAMTGETLLLDGGQRFLGLARDVQFLSLDDETPA